APDPSSTPPAATRERSHPAVILYDGRPAELRISAGARRNIQAEEVADVCEDSTRDASCSRGALVQDGEGLVRVGGEPGALFADRGQQRLEQFLAAALEQHVAEPAGTVVCLELLHDVAIGVEGIQVGEDHVAFDAAGIAGTQVAR